MKNGFKVIDGDAHMQEPFDLWKDYVEPEYYDRRPVVSDYVGKIRFIFEPHDELFPQGNKGSEKKQNAQFLSPKIWRDQERKYS